MPKGNWVAKEPYLREGMTHPAVARVKGILAAHGYWKGPVPASGNRFGPKLTEAVTYFQQTHINQHGKPCGVDGEIGPETWWALNHPSGLPQRSGIRAAIPAGLSEAREKVLRVALSQHGVKEVPSGSNRGPKVDKYLPSFWLKLPGPAWCCFFFSWCDLTAFGRYSLGHREGSCRKAIERAKAKGIWVPSDRAGEPVPGDAFVMLYGKGGHIGWVLRGAPEEFNTVEGNCGNRVKQGLRDWDERVVGFIDVCGDRAFVKTTDYERGVVAAESVGRDTTR